MQTDHCGRIIFEEVDLVNMVMRGQPLANLNGLIVQPWIDLETAAEILDNVPGFVDYDKLAQETQAQFDHRCRSTWFMPEEYKQLDIAELVISRCSTPEQLQRCGQELLLYQARDLFDLLRIVSDMNFEERISTGGIIIMTDNGKSTGIRPRWGQVYAVGPDQQDIRVGDWICVEHGRWTRGLDIEDETGKITLRRVDPKDVMMTADEKPDDLTFSGAIHVEAKPSHMQHN
jgi:hypothetical protein